MPAEKLSSTTRHISVVTSVVRVARVIRRRRWLCCCQLNTEPEAAVTGWRLDKPRPHTVSDIFMARVRLFTYLAIY